MKKIKTILKIITLIITTCSITKVSASSLSSEAIAGVYGIFISDDYYSFPMDIYRMDGRVAYCIQPGTQIITSNYLATSDTSLSGLSQDKIDYIKLVAYYGYDYYNHQNYNYYIAAQELIWEKVVDGGEGYYTTTQEVHGEKIDIEKYKEEILNLIAKHNEIPSFADTKVVKLKNKDVTIEDKNNVLSSFELTESGASINKNKLTITSDTINKISLEKKLYTDKVFLLYYYSTSQKMISAGIIDAPKVDVYVEHTGANLEVKKFGEEFDITLNDYHKIPLDGVTFNLYAKSDIVTSDNVIHYKSGDLIDTFTTNKEGKINTILYFGEYCLVEKYDNFNYKIEDNPYCFTLSHDDSISIYNYLKKGSLKVIKKDDKTGKTLQGTTIGLYTMDSKLIASKTTDNTGSIIFSDIPLGSYYIKELEASEGYFLNNDKIYVEVLEDDKLVTIDITNEKIVKVPKTADNEYDISKYMFLVNIIGLFMLRYGFKKI